MDVATLHTTTCGEGPSVLFVHGLDSDSTVWEQAIDLLGDHRCMTVDLPGHGKSPTIDDPAAYERESVLEILDAIVTSLPAPVVLVGHSLGGYLGLAHALTRPGMLGGLVLVSTGPGFRDPAAREGWNDRVRASMSDYGIAPVAAEIGFHVDSMVIDRLTELTLPITMIIGGDDKAYLGANDYMERKLPHASRTTVDGARHYVMRSHPADVAAAVRTVTEQLT